MDIKQSLARLWKLIGPLFNTRAAGLYILLFAASIAIATFIENDFGTSSAQKVIFKARWFELLLILFSCTLVNNIIRFRMVQNKKWPLLIFHLSMIIILIGSGITRYISYEGMMHIRENDQSNSFLSSETYLQFEVIQNGMKYQFDEHVLFATLGNNNFHESYQIGNDLIDVRVKNFIPNPAQKLVSSETGLPILKIVFGGTSGREEIFIRQGESPRIRSQVYNFTNTYQPGAINLYYRNDSILIRADRPLAQTVMATQKQDTLSPRSNPYPLRLRSLYSDGSNSFVFGDFNPNGKVTIESENRKMKNESLAGLVMTVSINERPNEIFVYGRKGMPGRPAIIRDDHMSLSVAYGAKPISLPFSVKLNEFILEKYPGTNSAMSYASEVQLIDSRKNLTEDHRIFMNHILDYGGYRFFQSSFDKDEKGTYLSVNHDFWGTWVSYIGYILLTIGLVMVFFSKNTRFYQITQKVNKLREQPAYIILLLFMTSMCLPLSAQKVIQTTQNVVSSYHAEQFSKVVVQDHNGRMKPVHTLTRELMRKMSRTESIGPYNADQIILSMFADKQSWLGVPLIKTGTHKKLQDLLGSTGERAAYKDFFLPSGAYKLQDEVRRAYGLQPIDRGQFEKDLMKIDERVNIANMIFSGRIFRFIPLIDDPNNLWIGNGQHGGAEMKNPVADRFFPSYQSALKESMDTRDFSYPGQILTELVGYQNDKGQAVMPSKPRINFEILLNNMNVFGRLAGVYALLGIGFLILLFISVFKPSANLKYPFRIMLGLVVAGFVFHTIGLGIRWYVSGRAPWSNGYESMIYIAWTTTLAGVLFTRKSLGGLAATMVLAGTILLVAMLSYLDPEITPLVPVLRSYWLTIHVSLEAGSYGFLMLGAIIGLINLILMTFLREGNSKRIQRMVQELSYISELTCTGGLVMVSVGTYLGGVWANESWGRYWGWDAKETWALVTILVYAFILHMRLIPKLNGLFSFNLATMFGFASVVMTYYGVNYYLSGLHSYAAGDPIPVPSWVYIATACVTIIALIAYWRTRKVKALARF